MSAHVEWVDPVYLRVAAPGEITDKFGTTNQDWAIVADGMCIEGDPKDLASTLRDLAKELTAISKMGDGG